MPAPGLSGFPGASPQMSAAEQGQAGAPAPANAGSATDAPIRDLTVSLPDDFFLDSGERLTQPKLALRIARSAKAPVDAPMVAVAGGISANRFVSASEGVAAWWTKVARPGGGIDPDQHRILSFDFLPNPAETATTISTADQARALAYAIEALDLPKLHAFVGASYGGMVALAFAEAFPEKLARIAVISAAHKPDAMATAWRGIQRRIVAFALESGDPERGLALARELAMTTYRAPDELEKRFDCAPQGDRTGDPYDVCGYLIARGEAFNDVMTPQRFLTLSDSLDRHQVAPEAITVPSLLVSANTDRLVSPVSMAGLSEAVGAESRYVEMDTPYGHDAFLKEPGQVNTLLSEFLSSS